MRSLFLIPLILVLCLGTLFRVKARVMLGLFNELSEWGHRLLRR